MIMGAKADPNRLLTAILTRIAKPGRIGLPSIHTDTAIANSGLLECMIRHVLDTTSAVASQLSDRLSVITR